MKVSSSIEISNLDPFPLQFLGRGYPAFVKRQVSFLRDLGY